MTVKETGSCSGRTMLSKSLNQFSVDWQSCLGLAQCKKAPEAGLGLGDTARCKKAAEAGWGSVTLPPTHGRVHWAKGCTFPSLGDTAPSVPTAHPKSCPAHRFSHVLQLSREAQCFTRRKNFS